MAGPTETGEANENKVARGAICATAASFPTAGSLLVLTDGMIGMIGANDWGFQPPIRLEKRKLSLSDAKRTVRYCSTSRLPQAPIPLPKYQSRIGAYMYEYYVHMYITYMYMYSYPLVGAASAY